MPDTCCIWVSLVRCTLPVRGVFVLEIFQKLVVEVNFKAVTGSLHLLLISSEKIYFAFIGGNTPIECHFSNIYVENAKM